MKGETVTEPIGHEELARVLRETGARHHRAFTESDGADPEWALWYATELQSRVWERFGKVPTRGELVYLLIGAERAFRASDHPAGEWPAAYARFILEALDGD
jgi:NAD(P)H-hydrate epimerase